MVRAGVTDTYDGESVKRLIHPARSLLADDGRLVLMSFLRDQDPAAVFFGALMTINGSRGETHTQDDYGSWLAAGGLGLDEVVQGLGPGQPRVAS